MDKKAAAIRQEVLAVFAEYEDRPVTATEVQTRVRRNRRQRNVSSPGLGITALTSLLESMTTEGALIERTGKQWQEAGKPFHKRRDDRRYWTTTERAQAWRAEHSRANEQQRRSEAETYATAILTERHREEYDQLVADRMGLA